MLKTDFQNFFAAVKRTKFATICMQLKPHDTATTLSNHLVNLCRWVTTLANLSGNERVKLNFVAMVCVGWRAAVLQVRLRARVVVPWVNVAVHDAQGAQSTTPHLAQPQIHPALGGHRRTTPRTAVRARLATDPSHICRSVGGLAAWHLCRFFDSRGLLGWLLGLGGGGGGGGGGVRGGWKVKVTGQVWVDYFWVDLGWRLLWLKWWIMHSWTRGLVELSVLLSSRSGLWGSGSDKIDSGSASLNLFGFGQLPGFNMSYQFLVQTGRIIWARSINGVFNICICNGINSRFTESLAVISVVISDWLVSVECSISTVVVGHWIVWLSVVRSEPVRPKVAGLNPRVSVPKSWRSVRAGPRITQNVFRKNSGTFYYRSVARVSDSELP